MKMTATFLTAIEWGETKVATPEWKEAREYKSPVNALMPSPIPNYWQSEKEELNLPPESLATDVIASVSKYELGGEVAINLLEESVEPGFNLKRVEMG